MLTLLFPFDSLAPEVLREDSYSEKADVFSFGVIMWELVTLKKPYEELHPMRVMYMVAHQGVTLQIPDDCPPAIAELIRQCWEEPAERPSFKELLKRLESIPIESLPNWRSPYTL